MIEAFAQVVAHEEQKRNLILLLVTRRNNGDMVVFARGDENMSLRGALISKDKEFGTVKFCRGCKKLMDSNRPSACCSSN